MTQPDSPAPSDTWLLAALEVIDDPQPRTAAFNMAADESLLKHLDRVPILRIYRWRHPAVSFGYFTPFSAVRVAEQPERDRDNHELVRRWTGGGIVEHGADFTYSLLVPRAGLAALGRPAESYRAIHGALGRAMSCAGIQAVAFEQAHPAGSGAGFSHCFARPVLHDLMTICGRKAAGAAQRRTRNGLLHQGSVQNAESASVPTSCWREGLAQALPGILCAAPVQRAFSRAEEGRATHLAEVKYATQTWLQRSADSRGFTQNWE